MLAKVDSTEGVEGPVVMLLNRDGNLDGRGRRRLSLVRGRAGDTSALRSQWEERHFECALSMGQELPKAAYMWVATR